MRVMHLGEAVEWNDNFRFYITTKLPRPHYLPEVSTKVTLINFMITEHGLQDQLLQRVMMSERKEVEQKKQALTLEAAANQAGLKSTEDRILAILSADGNILESEEAINELDSSKEQSDRIAKRQGEIEAMERISNRTRDQFVPVAHLGAILFFCVTELSNIDPMYQNSLQSYVSIFDEALRNSEKSTEVEERIGNVNAMFKSSLFERISRSLFARDQLLFTFIMSLKIYTVDPLLLRWLLMGGFEGDNESPENPFFWLPEPNWRMLHRATSQLEQLSDLARIVKENEMFFRDYYESTNPLSMELPAPLDRLSPFEMLLIVRCFRTDNIVPAITGYVRDTLGEFFVVAPLYALDKVVDELETDPSVPIILVLSPGADPNAELDRLADQRGMAANHLYKLSLGQGQDVPARELIKNGTQEGNWVFLQNCHLYADFMPSLSRIIEDYSDATARDNLNRKYRLWLTSLPSDIFPIVILQNGVKLVQEPPKGLKSNLLQSLLSDPICDESFFNSSNKPEIWRKMLFGLCFFHAVVQERRQFGPLGWNRPYEFNDTDRRISVRQLNMFLNENDVIPYDALLYLVGECNYGGRVTDDWDRRCLMATLEVYFNPMILEDDYVFCDDAAEYYAPPFGDYDSYVAYTNELPLIQPPTIFGLHENADITKDERDAKILLAATLATQPRDSTQGSSATLDPRATVKQLAGEVLGRLPVLFDIEAIQKEHPIDYAQSMNTVLLQEAIRYNRLLAVARRTLQDVQDAIDGKVVMSSELEQVFNDIFDGKVPEMWKRLSYPSLKPFGAYLSDLIARLQFLQRWCSEGPPPTFWLSGFFFTQSFLTGVVQNYARKHKVEIDKLVWNFTVMSETTFEEAPPDGCYIYGLFLEGAGWEDDVLCESRPKELFISFPVIKLVPMRAEDTPEAAIYHCPCYKTTDRKGVLSTTGHSTNFILTIDLPRDPEITENHWVLRGVALFTQLEY
ncbi:dynein heavy chain [Strigomonas culicis]|uniref:Dynein heavy chain n=1 Tax=Strigomonas culicis TaxID=28005 RepID=S9UKQ6_9TRYP|nr:dynein heavy chain [Strigomonas culicis]|eukprot:EPY29498.1 dynein heavy chain [Strigomonas culicis]